MTDTFEWLKNTKEDRYNNLTVVCESNEIITKIGKDGEAIDIAYKKKSNSTVIESKFLNKWTEVDEDIKDLFYEDFEGLIRKRKSGFDSITISVIDGYYYSEIVKPILIRCLPENQIKLKKFSFESLDVKQAIPLIMLINPNNLECISFWPSQYAVLDSDDFLPLEQWVQDCRLVLCIRFGEPEKAVDVKKILFLSSIFRKVILQFFEPLTSMIDGMRTYFAPFTFEYQDLNYARNVTFSLSDSSKKLKEPSVSKNADWLRIFGLRDYMEIIISDLDFFTIHKLRKVSQDIRSCIDEIKPDLRIKVYSMKRGHCYGIETTVEIQNGKFGTNGEANPMLFADLEYNLKNQKSIMREFQLSQVGTVYLQMVAVVLSHLYRPLRVKQLTIEDTNEDDLMEIIPFLDVDSLESIRISRHHIELEYFFKQLPEIFPPQPISYLTMDRVCELDQWKNANELIVKDYIILTPIQNMNIINFATLDIIVNTISTDDIFYLKEELLKSSKFQKFKIAFMNSEVDETIYRRMGPTYHRTESVSFWCYKFSNNKNLLRVRYDVDKAVTFTRSKN